MGSNAPTTTVTLLDRLRQVPLDNDAWDEFIRRYGPRIYKWCRRYGAQHADAEEIVQIVLVKLLYHIQHVDSDRAGRFRAWLQVVTRNAWHDLCRHHRSIHGQGAGGDTVWELLTTVEAGDDLVAELDDEYDRAVFEEAKKRVQLLVEPQTWQAFALTVIEGVPNDEAAKRLGIPIGVLYLAKSRVKAQLKKMVRLLSEPTDD